MSGICNKCVYFHIHAWNTVRICRQMIHRAVDTCKSSPLCTRITPREGKACVCVLMSDRTNRHAYCIVLRGDCLLLFSAREDRLCGRREFSFPLWGEKTAVIHCNLAAETPSKVFARSAYRSPDCLPKWKKSVAGFVKETRAGLAGRRKISYSTSHIKGQCSLIEQAMKKGTIGAGAGWATALHRCLHHPVTSLDEEKNFSTSRLAKRAGLL